MRLKFKKKSDKEIHIINVNTNEAVGQVFTPSGTNHDIDGAIQICGFDEAFDFWGCGIFADGNGVNKKDIQLMFNENSRVDRESARIGLSGRGCPRCYNDPCTCEVKGKGTCPYKIKRLEEIVAENL